MIDDQGEDTGVSCWNVMNMRTEIEGTRRYHTEHSKTSGVEVDRKMVICKIPN